MNKTYLVLPNCDDTNRGDQALIWETVSIARQSGFSGDYYMLSEKENSKQSAKEAIEQMSPILPHPSTHFKSHHNIQYGFVLKMQWMVASLYDATNALLLSNNLYRKLFLRFYSKEIQSTIRVFEKADAAFVKGGGFLHTYGGIINTYQNFYDLYHVILAQKMNIPVYIMPNSFGPFLSPFSAKLVKRVISKCKVVTSRESISQRVLLEETGIQSKLMPDLAFFLEPDDTFSDEQKKKISCIPFGEKCVALTVRPYRFPGKKNSDELYMQYKLAICDVIKTLSKEGFYPVLVEHTYSPNQHEQDMSCIRDVQGLLKDAVEYAVYSDLTLTCRQLKYVYSKFACVIGTRFHSVIFSIASGVPAIAISYGGNKGKGIMDDIGLSEYVLPMESITGNALIEMFEKIMKEKASVQGKIRDYLDDAEKRKRELVICLQKKEKL